MYFVSVVRHLLRHGVLVTIDEFQRCGENGILEHFPETLDRLKGASASLDEGESWGTLLIMGSHQQKMLHMVSQTGSMFGRSKLAVNLRPWNVRTVLEVAAEYRLLERPERFLTLWTAFDGMPGHWEDLVVENHGGGLDAVLDDTIDDRTWRRGFLKAELERLRQDPAARFDNNDWISLSPGLRQVMVQLGREKYRKGMELTRIRAGILNAIPKDAGKPDLNRILSDLEKLDEHLGMIRETVPFLSWDDKPSRWKLDDPIGIFQTRVFPELFRPAKGRPGTRRPEKIDVDLGKAVTGMETLEGEALERFVAEAVLARTGVSRWVEHGARVDGDLEVDIVAALDHWPARPVLLLGECKRNPDNHKPHRPLEAFEPDRGPGLRPADGGQGKLGMAGPPRMAARPANRIPRAVPTPCAVLATLPPGSAVRPSDEERIRLRGAPRHRPGVRNRPWSLRRAGSRKTSRPVPRVVS